MNIKYSLVEIDNLLWVEGFNNINGLLVIRIPVKILSLSSIRSVMSPQENRAYQWLESNHPESML